LNAAIPKIKQRVARNTKHKLLNLPLYWFTRRQRLPWRFNGFRVFHVKDWQRNV